MKIKRIAWHKTYNFDYVTSSIVIFLIRIPTVVVLNINYMSMMRNSKASSIRQKQIIRTSSCQFLSTKSSNWRCGLLCNEKKGKSIVVNSYQPNPRTKIKHRGGEKKNKNQMLNPLDCFMDKSDLDLSPYLTYSSTHFQTCHEL